MTSSEVRKALAGSADRGFACSACRSVGVIWRIRAGLGVASPLGVLDGNSAPCSALSCRRGARVTTGPFRAGRRCDQPAGLRQGNIQRRFRPAGDGLPLWGTEPYLDECEGAMSPSRIPGSLRPRAFAAAFIFGVLLSGCGETVVEPARTITDLEPSQSRLECPWDPDKPAPKYISSCDDVPAPDHAR